MSAVMDAPAREDDDEINLLEYWHVLLARRWIVAGVGVAVFAVALVFTLLSTPVYRASSTLQIERETLKIMDVQGLTPTESPMDRDFYQTQYELLQSRSLALRVIQDLRLVDAPQFADAVAAADRRAARRSAQGTGPGARQRREHALIDPVLKALTIEPVRNSRLVRINFDSPDRALAARVANAYANAFIASNIERRFEASSYASKFLQERLAQIKARLEDSEKALVAFATDEQIIAVENAPSLSAQSLGEVNSALSVAQKARIQAEAEWRQASAGDGLGLPQVVANPLVQKLREARAAQAAEYQQKLRTFKPDYPDMQRLAGQLAETDRQIAGEVRNIRDALRLEYQAALTQEHLLDSRLSALKGEVLDLQGRSIRYNILRREAETNRQLYDGLLQRYKEIGVVGNVGANNISVVDRADPPDDRHSPRIPLNLAVGLLLGLGAGVFAAFAVHHLDRRIRSPHALGQTVPLPVLGAIPCLPKAQTPAQAAVDLRSPFAEAYRSVRTALQFSTVDGLPRSLLFTSPGPGEGKSTSALELARNIAQLDRRVLLVDADLRNPSVHRLLGTSNGAGLTNILAGGSDAFAVVRGTAVPGLSVVTSGPIPPNPPELLAGDRLAETLAAFRDGFDVVVIDGPPVLGLADAPLLANRADATILVAAADHTRTDSLKDAVRRLAGTRAHVVGTLLTRHVADRAGDGYGYGGYAYYSYGESAA
jgi:capsular exopolysaccharide synthesis family protein